MLQALVRRPLVSAAAVVLAVALVITVVAIRDAARYENVDVSAAEEVLGHHLADTAELLTTTHEVAALRAALPDDQGLPADEPPLLVATYTSAGASEWCAHLDVDHGVDDDGTIRVELEHPWWAILLAYGCDQDVPAPGAVVVAIDARDLAAAELLTVDYDGRARIRCLAHEPHSGMTWFCEAKRPLLRE